MNKQQLASKIWESANRMRSKIEANEYKDYILGFIFYKYLSDKEVKFLKANDYTQEDITHLTEENPEEVSYIQSNIGYFIEYKNLFQTWLNMGNDFDVSNVRDALVAFSRLISKTHKRVFDNIFETLQTGLSKLGDSSGSQTKAVSGLLQLINAIPMDGKQDYDVLGFIYEYLISMFAANAGKKAGEFYTPHEVSLLMSEIVAYHLRNRNEIKIYDPTSGSGSLLINIGRSIAKHINDKNNIKYYAQELKENTYNLTRMNLVMRGILPDNIVTRNGDTLEEDWPYFDDNDPVNTYNPLYVDAVVSNPPYSQSWDPSGKENDPRFASFGVAPKSKADYAFLLHDLFHLKPDGIMTIVLPHGVLFRGGEEGEIRKNLIEQNHIDTIIGLPPNIFYGTGIPTIIMVLKQKRENTDILFIEASKYFMKEGKNNKLRASDIKRITDAFIKRKDIPKFSRVISREEIRENEYNLNIPRYIDSSENAESWDIYALMFGGIPTSEIDELAPYWKAFSSLRETLFTQKAGTPYATLPNEADIKTIVTSNPDVAAFKQKFTSSFETFRQTLYDQLIRNMETVPIAKEEALLSEDIFNRLDGMPLVDKYEAYQFLDEQWTKISGDLELIQTEGAKAITQVDPNLVSKKGNETDQEVQDGWIGHILPFSLVQQILLKEQTQSLDTMQQRLDAVASEYAEIIDSIPDEEKETEEFTEDKTAFIAPAVIKKAKALAKTVITDEDSYEAKIVKVGALLQEEKELKSKIKSAETKLITQTKTTIEHLSVEQANQLLGEKWITPLITSLNQMPEAILSDLVSKLQALMNKYTTTYFDIENQISETEASLSNLIDQLDGNPFDTQGLHELKKSFKAK
ncbi:MAG: type I restriction-modification system subunit M [Sphaerochaeta sp.]|jgi:type I restriction enzyme M protein|nr:type I restriction-modification system subunit M [Sphaerochaeta sp.]